MRLRFEQFNDSELYILKRALIEATKYIYQQEEITYTKDELDLLDNLLVEVIDNIKARELIEKNVSRYTEEKKEEKN